MILNEKSYVDVTEVGNNFNEKTNNNNLRKLNFY